jgi:hypothetical protein
MSAQTPHLLGRPVLFEIIEIEHPERGIAFRWLVSFAIADAPSLVFELKERDDALPTRSSERCYELLENGEPCCFGRWHFGPETARNSIVAVVESQVQGNLMRPASRKVSDRILDGERALPVAILHTLSRPGREVLNLFGTGAEAPHS